MVRCMMNGDGWGRICLEVILKLKYEINIHKVRENENIRRLTGVGSCGTEIHETPVPKV